jgi:hypothetical protein
MRRRGATWETLFGISSDVAGNPDEPGLAVLAGALLGEAA